MVAVGDDPGGDAYGNGQGWDVVGDYRAGTDDRAAADGHAIHDDDAHTQPDVILDDDVASAGDGLLGDGDGQVGDAVLVGIQGAARGQLHMIADVDAAQRGGEVASRLDVGVLADGDLAPADGLQDGEALDRGVIADPNAAAISMGKQGDVVIDEHALAQMEIGAVDVGMGGDETAAAPVDESTSGLVGTDQSHSPAQKPPPYQRERSQG